MASAEVKSILLFVGLFSFCINLLLLVGPIYMLQVYDRVLASGSMPTLVYLTIAAVGLIFAGALLEAARARVLVRLAGRLDDVFDERMFDRIHEMTLRGDGGQSRSLRDLETVRGFVTGAGLFFFFDAPWTPLFLAFVFMLHPGLFAVAFVGAVVLFVLAVITEFATRRPLGEAAGHHASASAFVESSARGVDAVEAMGMLPGLRRRWCENYSRGHQAQARASDYAGLLTAATKFVRPVLQIAILGVGAYLAVAQQITGGAMIAASIIMGRALAPVEGAIGNWRNFVMARAAFGRIRKLLSTPPQPISDMPLPAPKGYLTVDKLVAAVPGGSVPIIKGISFALNAGDMLGIIGPSAAGKSSLAKLMIGVWAPSAGHVRLDGMDVSQWNHVELGPHLGYLPQEVELFEGTIAENIARFSDGPPEATVEAAKRAGVHELILALENGYDTRVGPTGTTLSGGQRQRIGLARALYGNPAFIVLDEPNSNLDSEGENALRDALMELRLLGSTIVIVAHRPSVLAMVDNLLVLREGKIDAFGSREEIMSRLSSNTAQTSKKTAAAMRPRRLNVVTPSERTA